MVRVRSLTLSQSMLYWLCFCWRMLFNVSHAGDQRSFDPPSCSTSQSTSTVNVLCMSITLAFAALNSSRSLTRTPSLQVEAVRNIEVNRIDGVDNSQALCARTDIHSPHHCLAQRLCSVPVTAYKRLCLHLKQISMKHCVHCLIQFGYSRAQISH